MSDSKWVPGFIWVTAFGMVDKEVASKWSFLVDISSIEAIVENDYYRNVGLHCGRLILKNAGNRVEAYSVLETPEEIGELIRANWLKCHLTGAGN